MAGEASLRGGNQPVWARRYIFRLYPEPAQAEAFRRHCGLVAEIWNALLQRWEDIQRRTQQRQTWYDAKGKRHSGVSVHRLEWPSQCMQDGRVKIMPADKRGRPKGFSAFDMKNEVTWAFNEIPELREMSIWCGHRTADLLVRAIEGFYRRAGSGAGRASGYPQYRKTARQASVPHRFASGCKLAPDPRHRQSWRLTLKGIAGSIHARGLLPDNGVKWTDADLLWRDGKWWLSAAVEIARPRRAGRHPVTMRLTLVDEFALVDGVAETPPGLLAAALLADDLDRLKSAFDTRWPRGRRHDETDADERAAAAREISHLAARIARIRGNALHVWSAGIIGRASDLTIVMPPLRENLKSARGDRRRPGAEVGAAARLNRAVLGQAPGMARDLLVYKAAEAGIRCDVIDDPDTEIGLGADLGAARQRQRRAARQTRKEQR